MSRFASALIAWQKRHGRSGLPWQGTRDAYRIWLSEVMLQQTQVSAVIPYYQRFLERFPDVAALAAASQDEVLRLWSGLGYYARGRNLHAAAKVIAAHGFPRSAAEIERLPGVGRSTAAAIAAFAFGERAAILDGNVKRVLARRFGVAGWPGDRAVQAQLWAHAGRLLPRQEVGAYTQALMDLGATVCTASRPRCEACPVRASCVAYRTGQTAKIPAPRPRKPLPRKATTWLVVRRGDEILLEQRPAEGLWGGLWSFPECGEPKPCASCRERLGLGKPSRRQPFAPLEHGFTHFRLHIRPVIYERIRSPGRKGPFRWWSLGEALRGPIPTPVRNLLTALRGRAQ